MKHIVKRAGHTEAYDEKKLYASVYAACISVREHPGSAELIAQEVIEGVNKWIEQKHEVSSNEIRSKASEHLKVINPDAGHIYLHHRVVW
jgi:transcriptional regulator NrdR family protein